MHVLRNTAPIDGGWIGVIQPGEWLMHDQTAFELAMMAQRGTVAITAFAGGGFVNPELTSSLVEKPILIMRSGRFGDLLLASPAIAEFKKKLSAQKPSVGVVLSCFDQRKQIFDGTDLFEGFTSYPLNYPQWREHFGGIVSLEYAMEGLPEMHATDAFAKHLGVTVTDYKPIYKVSDEETKWAKSIITGDRPTVALQMMASVKNRNYPAIQWVAVIKGLLRDGWRVVLLGEANQWPALNLKDMDVMDLSKNDFTFRESAACLSVCDAFCGVDSAFIHLCHALDIPAVGLYGPFSWKTRTSKAPLTRALSGEGECAGCSWHIHMGQHFPPMPCRAKNECSVLASIESSRIVSKVNELKP